MAIENDIKQEDYSFLTLIKKEYDELVYSSMLAYYFNCDKELFVTFCHEVLGIKEFSGDYEIVRETENNIDLLIKNEKHVIVIENKIKSGINGIEHGINKVGR